MTDGTWTGNDSNLFDDDLNWLAYFGGLPIGNHVPTGTASFGDSNVTSISVGLANTIGAIVIEAVALTYTFNLTNISSGSSLVFNGVGISGAHN